MAFKGLFQVKPFRIWKSSLFSITWTRTIQLFRATYKMQQHLKTHKNLAEAVSLRHNIQHDLCFEKPLFVTTYILLKVLMLSCHFEARHDLGEPSHTAQHQQGPRAGRNRGCWKLGWLSKHHSQLHSPSPKSSRVTASSSFHFTSSYVVFITIWPARGGQIAQWLEKST